MVALSFTFFLSGCGVEPGGIVDSQEPADSSIQDPDNIHSDETDQANKAAHEAVIELMAAGELRCALCHSNEGGSNNGVNLESGSLSDFSRRLVNVNPVANGCVNELLIDAENPEQSLFLKLVNPNNTNTECLSKMPLGSSGVSAESYSQLVDWVNVLIVDYLKPNDTDSGPGTPGDDDFEVDPSNPNDNAVDTSATATPLNAFQVISKVKYIAAGTAVTKAELDAVQNSEGKLVQSEFEALVKGWLQSDDFIEKRRYFFELSLQQNPSDGNYTKQLRNSGPSFARAFTDNLEESYIRTAERIADAGEDFRTLLTTTKLEVTTATLLVFKMLDNAGLITRTGNFTKNNSINDLTKVIKDNYSREIDNDYSNDPNYQRDTSDWRTVDLRYEPNSREMETLDGFQDGTNLTSLRAIRDQDSVSLRTPRTLCSSPSFFQVWGTNQDNKFRAVVNQCLIIALGSTFSPGDPTSLAMHPVPGVDTNEISEGSECMGCHKNLDPMKSAFEKHFDYGHQRFLPNSQRSVDHYNDQSVELFSYNLNVNSLPYSLKSFESPYFSYRGVNEASDNLLTFLQSMVNHPDFAIAWAQKVCQWASSAQCSRQDPELIRIAQGFVTSGYNINTLFELFFTSKLVTHSSSDADTTYPGAKVSIARRDHYCHAIQVRLREVRRSRGLSNINENTDVCARNRKLAQAIPVGITERGAADFTLPTSISPFSTISLENLCSSGAGQLVGLGSRTFSRRSGDAQDTLKLMVTQVLGYPEQTPQFIEASEGLNQLYNVFRTTSSCSDNAAFESALSEAVPSCGLDLSEQGAMESAFSLVCQDPSLTTLGLGVQP